MSQLSMYLLGKLKNDKRYRDELTPEYQSLLEDFTIHLTQQQLSNLTIERAIYMIGKFLAFILSLRIIEVGTVTTDVINIFLSTMFRRGNQLSQHISVSYLTDYYINVKKLFAFLHDNGRIMVNPAAKIALLNQWKSYLAPFLQKKKSGLYWSSRM